MQIESFVQGRWQSGDGAARALTDAASGQIVGTLAPANIDFCEVLSHARTIGGWALRQLTFHERATLLERLGKALSDQKGILYELSILTGATHADRMLDVDGGIDALFSYASGALRNLPNDRVYLDGAIEPLSKSGPFAGQHILVSLCGAAVHINAYTFPVRGMLEKFAPAFLAGLPAIVNPATETAFVTERLVRMIVEAAILPEGVLQLVCGSIGDLFDHLHSQDVVAFTGPARTAQKLQTHPTVVSQSVRFMAEISSLNASILGPDATPETPEFLLFVDELTREMKCKAGQRCNATRRALVPAQCLDAASIALKRAFREIKVGDPRDPEVHMGPLVGLQQRDDVLSRIGELSEEGEIPVDELDGASLHTWPRLGAFVAPTLLLVRKPHSARAVHVVEVFGPFCALMPYSNVADAVALAARGGGGLVASVFTADADVARQLILGLAPYHDRVLIVDRDCASEQETLASAAPGSIQSRSGRADGGVELEGIRAVLSYMQRTAVRGTPKTLALLAGA